MNQREAFLETYELMKDRLENWTLNWGLIMQLPKECQPEHLANMHKVVLANDNPQHPGEPFGEGKLGRWLGWLQCAGAVLGVLSLEESKEINKKWASK